ncbi:selenium binding protein [Enterococcus hulanensis]|uniref:selenium binding protein n=1 Tax=Enterococcus hulanensis TaxID=2559929 RepID=UPI00289281DF|nr:selenium binding protein [Enterococcus hulanensis]MDT2661140.1 selenium binding protein [Enterococcus hulanensis]
MYEEYTRQALPSKEYRELLGTALAVFNSNNSFMIENFLRVSNTQDTWHSLIDLPSGRLKSRVEKVLAENSRQDIVDLFKELIDMRNRIIHSFQITNSSGEQVLATKEPEKMGSAQFEITMDYLMEFIKKNEKLSSELHKFRGF